MLRGAGMTLLEFMRVGFAAAPVPWHQRYLEFERKKEKAKK